MEQIPEYKFALLDSLKDHPEFLPTKAEPFATGWDVRCAEPKGIVLLPDTYYMIGLGVRVLAPPGYWLELVPRSSTFIKKYIHPLYGKIDEHFSMEVKFCCQFQFPSQKVYYEENNKIDFGDRIGQLIPVKRQEMIVTAISNEEIDKAFKERGQRAGFGSTGNK